MSNDKNPTPNDQRSNVKNPNNPAHKANQDNRSNQLNPNHKPTNPAPAKGNNKGK
jgi:hypothetical protein